MSSAVAGLALAFDEGHLFVLGIVAVIAYLATCTRRPQRPCPRCKEINRPQAIYCAQCGTRLPQK